MTRERYRGALIGLAAGDALGTTLEFESPGTFASLTEMIGGGPFDLKPGEWTDDTSMALCLAESLIERHGFDAKDQMERYCRWCEQGHLSSTGHCFDIGNTVRSALETYRRTRNPFSGSESPNAAGNGSLMRLAQSLCSSHRIRNKQFTTPARVPVRRTGRRRPWMRAVTSQG